MTANITNTYEAKVDVDYIVNSNDWQNTDFVITAAEGYKLSLTDTADGEWKDTLSMSGETAEGQIKFYVRNETTKAISLVVTENYRIDKTASIGTVKISGGSVFGITLVERKRNVTAKK